MAAIVVVAVASVANCFSVCEMMFLNRASSSSRVMVLCVMIWSRCSKKRNWYFCWKLVVRV